MPAPLGRSMLYSPLSPTFDFNDAEYLEANSDVREAIERGEISSALSHYFTFGGKEGRRGVPREITSMERVFNLPLPPDALRLRVSGSDRIPGFVSSGWMFTNDIVNALPPDAKLTAASKVLDFGCGCARVVSFFSRMHEGQFYGSDIDEEAINWCKSNIPGIAAFDTNGFWPPLRYSDEFFDLVYSVSIFTHLPEDMQAAWLPELRRVTKPGGYLLLTVHGSDLFPSDHVPPEAAEEFEKRGFYYIVGDKTEGLPDFYRTTFHSDAYIVSHWCEFFEIVSIVKKGLGRHQDIVVCRRK
jgi:SAM-dependent methyltransferase